MSITVQQVIELPILKEARVLTGKDQLSERRVEWMTATEGPVEDHVRKDEIILTTGMACNEREALRRFVEEVYEKKAAALAIATGKYIKSIPDEVIHFAEERRFILIELPWDVRFTDIQRETTKALNEKEQEEFEEAQQVQDRLFDYVIQGKDLTTLLQYVEQELQGRIVFTDDYGRLVTVNGNEPERLVDLWASYEKEGKTIQTTIESSTIDIAEVNGRHLIKKEVVTNTDQLGGGFFLIDLEKDTPLDSSTIQRIESLASATAIWLSREDAIVKTELRLKNQFIWELAKSKDVTIDDKAQARASLFGFQLDAPYVCIVGYADELRVSWEEKEDTYGQKTLIDDLEEVVRDIAQRMNRQVALTLDEQYIVIFFEAKKTDKHVYNFIEAINEQLEAMIEGAIFSWGIGQEGKGIKTFHESYEKAFSALEMVITQKEPGEVLRFEETRLNRLLLELTNNGEILDITYAAIEPLIEYEKERGIDLIETFIVYDQEKRNVSQAARALNLHRQSLLYRLDKINKLTNLSVDHPDDAFLLNISIKVYQASTM